MKVKVPFYKQTGELNCGPTNLKMVFSYFGKNYDITEIEREVGIKENKAVSTINLAIATASLGYKVYFFSKHLSPNKENLKLEYYKKYASDFNEQEILVKKAMYLGVKVEERRLSLEEILAYVTNKGIPIILIDYNKLLKRSGYLGHFVPIVGYSDKNVYIHNSDSNLPKAFLKIDKKLFDKSRKAEGTDEDILIIFKD